MAKFAQYYLEYCKDELFSGEEWERRQSCLGAYFESDKGIDFTFGEGEQQKTYKHNVYHLSINKSIIVMRIANDKVKGVIQDFKPVSVRHEPPCFVIIDNRDRCRRIAIQRNKDSFNTTESLKKIVQQTLDTRMRADHSIGLVLHPQYYTRDFYKAWRARQYSTSSIRFNISGGQLTEQPSTKELDDHSVIDWAIKVNEEEMKKKYKTVLELNPPDDKAFLEVDESSVYIRNLVAFHACTGAPIEIVTNDGARFTCYIDDDEESDSIVTNEIENEYLEALFPETGDLEDEEVRKLRTDAENKMLEFVNKMKIVVDEDNGKEKVA